MRSIACAACAALGLLALAGCEPQGAGAPAAGSAATTRSAPAEGAASETADEFVARVNRELTVLAQEAQAAGFTQDTYITPDTELLNARATERYLAYLSRAVAEAQRYDGLPLEPATARALMKLRLNVAAPAPDDPEKRARMTQLEARMQSMYGEGKYCPRGPKSCETLDQLQEIMATSRDYAQLLDAWKGWHGVGAGMRDDYTEFVALANEGARELGFADLGVMWRSGYDMPPQAFEELSGRLWQQVKPLYVSLQCYARARLAQRYGADKVPPGKPIPAHLFGNMWAQQWTQIYPDILRPYPRAGVATADARLKSERWDAVRLTRSAESFYTSLGFAPLPASFWQHSMLTRPRDREVVCHASAWDMAFPGDVRVKACLEPTEHDLYTIYHELGHVYYYLSYAQQPYLFRDGANDGFHEAIGDTVNLSVTPEYLASIRLIPPAAPGHEALINADAHQPADEDGTGEDRLPALRPGDRRVALESLLRRSHRRELQQRLVGAAPALPGHRTSGAAHRGGLRSRRQVPHPFQHALRALFPLLHPAVPVPQGAVRGRRQPRPALRVLDLRQP